MLFASARAVLDFLTPARLLSRLTIASKIMLGFMMLVVLTVGVVIYAIASLSRLNDMNNEVVMTHIPVQEAAGRMIDALLAQDTYQKRYLILQSDDTRILYVKRGKEFDAALEKLQHIERDGQHHADSLSELHKNYEVLFGKVVRLVRSGDINAANDLSNRSMNRRFEKMLTELRNMAAAAKTSQDNTMQLIRQTGAKAYGITMALCFISILFGGVTSMVITHHIASSLKKLTVATVRIADGDFAYDPCIASKDEVGMLADAFLQMGKRLAKLEEMYLDASPLTRLPGGVAIENVLKRRIDSGAPFAFCVLDLDNFKAFNDHYGYAHGNDVIKETAHIIEAEVREKGSEGDFVGHIGGDDFVVITTPRLMRDVCNGIIGRFDERIPSFYNEEDRKNGYIFGKTRQGQEMRFPLMTVSIAVVTNELRKFANYLEASEVAASLKDYAKTIPQSIFVVDKRRSG